MDDRSPEAAGTALRDILLNSLRIGTLEMAYRADYEPMMVKLGYWPIEIETAVAYCIMKGWVSLGPSGIRLMTSAPF
jgi:hypothetical protein